MRTWRSLDTQKHAANRRIVTRFTKKKGPIIKVDSICKRDYEMVIKEQPDDLSAHPEIPEGAQWKMFPTD